MTRVSGDERAEGFPETEETLIRDVVASFAPGRKARRRRLPALRLQVACRKARFLWQRIVDVRSTCALAHVDVRRGFSNCSHHELVSNTEGCSVAKQ